MAPGDCSPSRRVVSKTRTYLGSGMRLGMYGGRREGGGGAAEHLMAEQGGCDGGDWEEKRGKVDDDDDIGVWREEEGKRE